MNGTLNELTLSPIRPKIAGRRVIAAATAARTTKIAPAPIDIKMLNGIKTMPINASTTVMPLNATAREAVAPAYEMASIFSNPRPRSSR